MNIQDMTSDVTVLLAAGGAALGLLGAALALLAVRAAHRLRGRASSAEAQLSAVCRELERLSFSGVNIERRVKRAEQDALDITGRIDQFELRAAPQSIDQAIDYARRGADSGKLTKHFGLSQSEAELMARLHGRRKRA
jgi:hypothetical protein